MGNLTDTILAGPTQNSLFCVQVVEYMYMYHHQRQRCSTLITGIYNEIKAPTNVVLSKYCKLHD